MGLFRPGNRHGRAIYAGTNLGPPLHSVGLQRRKNVPAVEYVGVSYLCLHVSLRRTRSYTATRHSSRHSTVLADVRMCSGPIDTGLIRVGIPSRGLNRAVALRIGLVFTGCSGCANHGILKRCTSRATWIH